MKEGEYMRTIPFPKKAPEWRIVECHKGYRKWYQIEECQGMTPGGELLWAPQQEFASLQEAQARFDFLVAPLRTKVIAEA